MLMCLLVKIDLEVYLIFNFFYSYKYFENMLISFLRKIF